MSIAYSDPLATPVVPAANTSVSGVSWAAIFAGAMAAASLSLLLFILGTGLGLSSVSVWTGQGMDAGALGWTAVAWIAFTQLASAGVGGYLAGRLRTRWQGGQGVRIDQLTGLVGQGAGQNQPIGAGQHLMQALKCDMLDRIGRGLTR